MTEPQIASPETVLAFWREAGYEKWFKRDDAFDAAIREKFMPTYEAAAAGQLSSWEATADGALALCLVLDQFPRNMFRSDARTYAADRSGACGCQPRAQARIRSGRGGRDARLLLPAVHALRGAGRSGTLRQLYREAESTDLKYAEQHRDIIRRFGRFPHRNAIFGRDTTPEEQKFLDDGGFKG